MKPLKVYRGQGYSLVAQHFAYCILNQNSRFASPMNSHFWIFMLPFQAPPSVVRNERIARNIWLTGSRALELPSSFIPLYIFVHIYGNWPKSFIAFKLWNRKLCTYNACIRVFTGPWPRALHLAHTTCMHERFPTHLGISSIWNILNCQYSTKLKSKPWYYIGSECIKFFQINYVKSSFRRCIKCFRHWTLPRRRESGRNFLAHWKVHQEIRITQTWNT